MVSEHHPVAGCDWSLKRLCTCVCTEDEENQEDSHDLLNLKSLSSKRDCTTRRETLQEADESARVYSTDEEGFNTEPEGAPVQKSARLISISPLSPPLKKTPTEEEGEEYRGSSAERSESEVETLLTRNAKRRAVGRPASSSVGNSSSGKYPNSFNPTKINSRSYCSANRSDLVLKKDLSDLEDTGRKGKKIERSVHQGIRCNVLEQHPKERVMMSHHPKSDASQLRNLTNEGTSQRSAGDTAAGASTNGDSVLQVVLGMLELLRAGQQSLREEMAGHTALVAGGLETKEVATMEKLTHLDIKLADVYKKQRQAALDMRAVIEGIENIHSVLELGEGVAMAEGSSRKKIAKADNDTKVPRGSRLPVSLVSAFELLQKWSI